MTKRIMFVMTMLLLSVAGAWADGYDPQNPPDPNALFQLSVSASPTDAGYVSGGGRYKEGQQIWLSTSSRANYDFQYWACDGERISNEASFYYTMPKKSVSLVAVYAFNPSSPADPTTANAHRLYLDTNMEGSCTFNITSGARHVSDRSILVKAMNISQGFKFLGWYLGDEKLSDNLSFYYMMPNNDITLTAHFSYDPDSPDDPTSVQTDIDNTDYIPGDANGDGEVNVTDIVEIVNAIMNRPSTRFVRAAADLNSDGEINVTDIVKVVNLIMTAGNSPSLRRTSRAESASSNGNQLQLLTSDNRTFSLQMNNQDKYVASQFDLYLAKGMTLQQITLNESRCSGHTLSYTDIGSNCYRIVVLSTNNAVFEGNSGELLNFEVTGSGTAEMENILFVTEDQTETWFDPIQSWMTTELRTIEITKTNDIYSLDGRLVRKTTNDQAGMKKGIYIKNGNKYIVK